MMLANAKIRRRTQAGDAVTRQAIPEGQLTLSELDELRARLQGQRRTRLGRSGALGPAIKALHDIADILDAERWERRRLGIYTADITVIWRACYGPIFVRNPHTGTWGPVPRRLRPEGALDAARAVSRQVVAALGGESGATAEDARTAADRLAEAILRGQP